jgi:N-acetylglucosaminyldiphosphoundecaprenol N-acetyl-beta-D-mannosaminyltransferase
MNTDKCEDILGFQVTTMNSRENIEQILSWIDSGEIGKVLVCANPHSLVVAKNDPLFQQAIHEGDLVTPDGVGIVLASKILGGSIGERVTGSDIFWGLSDELNKTCGRSYFFLGSTAKNLAAIKKKMAKEYPNIRFAGSYSPPYRHEFGEEDSRLMIEAVNTAEPDVLWIGMTAPKQEKWIFQHRAQLNVKFIGPIGAVFDFYVGNVKRPNSICQRLGLEWLLRLLHEPRRLFRRNFVSSPLFLWRVFLQAMWHPLKHKR